MKAKKSLKNRFGKSQQTNDIFARVIAGLALLVSVGAFVFQILEYRFNTRQPQLAATVTFCQYESGGGDANITTMKNSMTILLLNAGSTVATEVTISIAPVRTEDFEINFKTPIPYTENLQNQTLHISIPQIGVNEAIRLEINNLPREETVSPVYTYLIHVASREGVFYNFEPLWMSFQNLAPICNDSTIDAFENLFGEFIGSLDSIWPPN